MSDLTIMPSETLPSLIDRASRALSAARDSAEVLEARDMARVAYDAAKSAGRMARAKKAHDEVIGAVYRAQADALLIEARAKVRLADEYDAAQERGEVAKLGDNLPSVGGSNSSPATAADIGIRRDEIHEARKLRDAEAANPGATQRALEAMVERGEEPTKAKLRREVASDPVSAPEVEAEPDPHAKLRAEFRKLTPEAQEEDWIALRIENAEMRKRVADQRGQIADLKAKLAEALSEDMGRALGNSQRQRDTLNGRLAETMQNLKRMERRLKIVEGERDAARREIEGTLVPLGPQ